MEYPPVKYGAVHGTSIFSPAHERTRKASTKVLRFLKDVETFYAADIQNIYSLSTPLPKYGPDLALVDLFCGIGGVSLGAMTAARKWGQGALESPIAYALDHDQAAAQTFRHNLTPNVDRGSIEYTDAGLLALANNIWRNVSKSFHMHASPPCEKVSQGGLNRAVNHNLVRALNPTFCMLKLVRILQNAPEDRPQLGSFSIELNAGNGGIVGRTFMRLAHKLRVDCIVVNSADLGSPQRGRLRMFLGGGPWLTHIRTPLRHGLSAWTNHAKPFKTLPKDVFLEIARSRRGIQVDKSNWKSYAIAGSATRTPSRQEHAGSRMSRGGNYNRPRNITDGMRPLNVPCHTITRIGCRILKYRAGKWHFLRYTNTRECLALQGFPMGYELSGPASRKKILVANAVPVQLFQSVWAAVLQGSTKSFH